MEYDPDIIIDEHPDVYPPSEDSILLIECLDVRKGERVLEIGCGSGVVSIHCASNGCDVTSVDINPYAVELTGSNFYRNGLKGDVSVSDVYSNVEGRFDTIIFNLPYLPTEDDIGIISKAWDGGSDGMGPLPELLNGAPEHLLPNGRVVIVVSSLMDKNALDNALSGLEIKVLGELPLFFEVLRVLEIRGSS
ncbi:MAG: methyltransferase domain-containing protein [Thermoplasmata archaeon]|nr:methyltransferase domain-containing protein [Thermoplasmata archaeon]